MNRAEVLDRLNVSRETSDNLDRYVDLLEKWTKKINLISRSTIEAIWARHVLDSAQVYSVAPRDHLKWVDMGSGGGLPALVAAVLDKEECGWSPIHSDRK